MKVDWDERFINTAKHISTWSKDRNTGVGAIIVDSENKRIVSTGYNGFVRGSDDDIDSRHERPIKYFFTVHAEANAIYHAAKHGISVDKCDIYVTLFPCAECCKAMIQSGIKRLICPEPEWDHKTWGESFSYSKTMLDESGVEIKFVKYE